MAHPQAIAPLKPGYKKSEAGVIPAGWTEERLGSLGRWLSGGTPSMSKATYWVGDIPWVSPKDMKIARLNDSLDHISVKALSNGTRLAPQHALLMVVRGMILAHSFPVARAERPLAFNQDIKALVTRDDVDSDFLLWWLQSHAAMFLSITTESTHGTKRMPTETLFSRPVALPPIPEQRAIAAALGDVDALIGALDRLIAKKRDLKQGAMQQLLTGQNRLPGFHGAWQTAMVREVITEYFSGPSPTCLERNINGDLEWGVLKTTAITKEHGWDWRRHKVLPLAFWDSRHIELRIGDVIVTKAGPRHRVGVAAWIDFVPNRIIPSGKMVALRPNSDRAVPLMLSAAISAKDSQIFLDQRTTGMAESQVNFENEALLQTPIRIPEIEEQTAIAAVLSDMDAEIAALEARRDKTRLLKQGMMQELLTGKTRLV